MTKIAIIGGGLSGLTVAHLLKEKNEIKIFERESKPGGLIKCERVHGSLYHICGGHVFNSKRQDVLDWFWSFFSREDEFVKAERNAVVHMDSGDIPNNQLTLSYKGTQTSGGTVLLQKVAGLSDLVNDLSGTYSIESAIALINPTLGIKFVKSSSSSNWLYLTGGTL